MKEYFREWQRWRRLFSAITLVAVATSATLPVCADVVHVYEQRSFGGTIEVLSDKTVDTNVKYVSQKADTVDGWIFTGWTVSTSQAFEGRTPWGCAYNYVEFLPYEDTILTANYVGASLDSDRDGMADGYELYWYGNLLKSPSFDGDGDGYMFAQEVQYGMNPHFFDEEVKAGVVRADGEKLDYNPHGYRAYTVRSEPEGELFETYWVYAKPGTIITTAKQNRQTTTFAYWKVGGLRQCDEFGRAVNQVSCTMPEHDIEIVAVCVANADFREQYYWYGAAKDMNSDSDYDGYYLFEEIAMGTSPLFPDEHIKGVVWKDSYSFLYNPYKYCTYTMRSEPEGALFETVVESVRPETILTTRKLDHLTSSFAQWKMDGVRQEDEFGRALSEVTFSMPFRNVELVAETRNDDMAKEKVYWYGDESMSAESDTDGDGYSFAEEIAQGTNPKFFNETLKNGVIHNESEQHEMNLQSYEQMQGAVVGGAYEQLFTSPIAGNAGTSVTFNNEVSPAVVDYNADGHFDMIIASKGGVVVYRNQGYVACPDFVKLSADEAGLSALDAVIASMHKPLLCGDGTNGVYYSDNGGRIFKYDFISRVITDMKIDGIPGVFDTSDWALSASMHNDSLVHRWSFNGSLKDSVTGNYAIKSGNVSSNGEQYTISGGSRGSSCINLGTNVLPSDGSPVTIELWATQHSIKNWSRILDFGRNNTDYICMTWTQGTDLNSAATRVSSIGGDVSGLAPYSLGVEYHIALVFEPQGNGVWRVTAYKQDSITGATLDKITFTSSAEWSLALQSQNNCYLGRSFFSADYDANASYNEVRVWKKALSESELTRSAVLGPDYKFNVENQEKIASNRELIVLDSNGNLKSLSGDKTYILDAPVIDGVSIDFADVNKDGLYDLLASDITGRIWFYLRISETEFVLQHKVWGGTYEGFANGLTLAAVDWEDDGDLDCICGTAEGKLMLLRDPKVGRPTNLKAFAGVNNILLTWDPNQQSRIRGYRVYRALSEQAGESSAGTRIAQPPLPTYRDFPPTTDEYAYKVSSVSRFYTAGNSTPTETESPATEAILARTGGVKFFWNDVVCKLGENANVMLSIENSMNYDVAGKTQTVKYDPWYLRPLKIAKTGLTENVTFTESFADGEWQIAMTGGTLPAGGGKFLTLVFETLKEGETKVGGDSGATVMIAARSGPVPPYQLGDVNGDGKLDQEDVRELARLKNGNGRKYTQNQLKAGDFNGYGKLDNADYQALREFLKEKGVL